MVMAMTGTEVTVRANLEKLIAKIGPDHDDTDASPNRLHYDSLRSMDVNQLAAEFDRFIPAFVAAIDIRNTADEKTELKNIEVITQQSKTATLIGVLCRAPNQSQPHGSMPATDSSD